MAQSAETFGQEALQFVGELDRVSTMEAVAERMSAITSRFGFEGLFIGGHKAHPSLTFNELCSLRGALPSFSRSIMITAISRPIRRSSARSGPRKPSSSRQAPMVKGTESAFRRS